MGCVPSSVRLAWGDFTSEIQKIPEHLAETETHIGSLLGVCAYAIDTGLKAIQYALVITAKKTYTFVKNNWLPLLAYVFAWGVIITCTGLMYGFEAVALKLTIGMGCGVIFGMILGVYCLKVDKKGGFTPWNFLNNTLGRLDDGTRQIVSSVAVTVLLAASIIFPYVMGAVYAILIGAQLCVKISTGQNLGKDPAKAKHEQQALKQELQKQIEKIADMEKRLLQLENKKEARELHQQMLAEKEHLVSLILKLEAKFPELIHDSEEQN